MQLKKGIRDFVQGYWNLFHYKTDKLAQHIREQAVWRASKCPACLSNKSCYKCGCSTPALFYAPRKTDSDGKWEAMLDQDGWENFKKSSKAYQDFITLLEDEGLEPNTDAIIEYAVRNRKQPSHPNAGESD